MTGNEEQSAENLRRQMEDVNMIPLTRIENEMTTIRNDSNASSQQRQQQQQQSQPPSHPRLLRPTSPSQAIRRRATGQTAQSQQRQQQSQQQPAQQPPQSRLRSIISGEFISTHQSIDDLQNIFQEQLNQLSHLIDPGVHESMLVALATCESSEEKLELLRTQLEMIQNLQVERDFQAARQKQKERREKEDKRLKEQIKNKLPLQEF